MEVSDKTIRTVRIALTEADLVEAVRKWLKPRPVDPGAGVKVHTTPQLPTNPADFELDVRTDPISIEFHWTEESEA